MSPRPAVLGALLLALLSVAGCKTDYEQMSRELAREDVVDPRQPIVEKQRSFFDRDTSRPRLETTYRVYPGGRKIRHGPERAWYADGQLQWERDFLDGEPTGVWRSYYPDGTQESETWPGQDPTGPAEGERIASWWHPNGRLSSRGPIVYGARSGTWEFWHDNGALAGRGSYAANRREGLWTFWTRDGSVAEQGRSRAGQRVGDWIKPR